jgi:hypothetical protein
LDGSRDFSRCMFELKTKNFQIRFPEVLELSDAEDQFTRSRRGLNLFPCTGFNEYFG